ncbi:ornithine cyclodeaminase family protein [Chloroflexota bacterium]
MENLEHVQFDNPDNIEEICPKIRRGKEILYLSRGEIESMNYNRAEIMELVRTALVEHGRKKVEMPPTTGTHPIRDTLHHAMPAFVPAALASGIKWVACFPQNYRFGLNQTSALVVMNDIQTGFPLAIMDGTWITSKRGAAVSALAVEKLARQDSEELAILGCGVQGQEHLLALSDAMHNLKKINIFDIRSNIAEQLIEKWQGYHDLEICIAPSVDVLVQNSDVIVTATIILKKPNPQIKDEWIKNEALLLPLDLDSVFEWKTMSRVNKFLVDSVNKMHYFASDGYLGNGLPPVYAEIGEVIAGLRPGRESNGELICNMNIGMGIVDVVVAKDILMRAMREGIGSILPL